MSMNSSKHGNSISVNEPRASSVAFKDDSLVVGLEDGRTIAVPLEWFPPLRDATEAQRDQWEFIGQGQGIHWPKLDEDLSTRGLLEPKPFRRANKAV
jgi:hypothetical protein